ncbi:hypothetical protein [Thermogymnomonas acidicola]|uniref:hypothetical protein n=1 Tax=Thermogymnomonas acidicola TaxID=399579 RepID=UPI0009466C66|nr:hypothetical protein [Thermogymnomonas acidicola]
MSGGRCSFILLSLRSFLGSFESFLSLLGDWAGPWSMVMVVHTLLSGRVRVHGPARPPLLSWLIGTAVAFLLSSSPFFTGPPLATGIFRNSDAGVLLGSFVSLVLSLVLLGGGGTRRPSSS